MNLLSITMDKDRSLTPSLYSLGVEGDHKIDKIVLIVPKNWEGTDVSNADVAIHVMTENGYFHNSVCGEREVDGERVRFLFPVTREMTCRCGKLKIEFYFSDASSGFSFTSRTAELFVADSLTNGEEIESDYPGLLWDVMNSVEGFSSRLESTESGVAELEKSVDSLADINAFIGYNDEEILGLEADFENNVFTRLAGARGLEAGADFDSFLMYQRRRCNVSDDGSILAYYGDENYRDDGTNGQVMVYQPAFYYRVVPTKLEKIEGGLGYHVKKASYYISEKPKPFFKLHPAFYDADKKPVEYILYGAYEGSVADSKLCSAAGVMPTVSATRFDFESLAKARGNGWHIETLQAISVNQLLFAIEYASFNCQETIGSGITFLKDDGTSNCASITGSTAYLGNGTGIAEKTVNEIGGVETIYSENGKVAVSYRGVENLWGNLYTHISNVNPWGDGTMLGGQLYICDDFDFAANKHDENYCPAGFLMPNGTMKYVASFGYGDKTFDWLFAPSSVGGTSLLPVGDYTMAPNDINAHYGVAYGGRYDTGFGSGLFLLRICGGSISSRDISGRLIFVPTAK